MSRREGRDSDTKRQSSRVDREPSPKRSRRDGKPEAERVLSKNDLDVTDVTDAEKKPHRHLRDAAPLESDAHALSKDAEKKHNGHQEMTKRSPNRSEAPRARPHYQHDERGGSGKGDRRAPAERGWWRSGRDQMQRRPLDEERSRQRRDREESMWRHDKFQEKEEDNQSQPARKRPAFREKKTREESGNTNRTEEIEHGKENQHDRGDIRTERRNERRPWRPPMGGGRDRTWNRPSYAGNNRERFNDGRGGGGFRGNGQWREEKKWEHDLFDEANKSPPKRNEEEQIAKLEALLSS
ncbi:PREDICTED: pre-mRNA-splicing factor 38B [Tarenaya hassleriana]|uniref:pre-mRNA-splicing factor 38B n=1 Tax=Tarenaya hassleriana TaxID=28532 RepID=UPI00053C311C|nr:PREDICTED: pre-mRNA-splicing factor 38B [Tarenaya hassleriana]